MLLYFDIETFSENGFRADTTKVISIQYKDHQGNLKILKEWESSEKDILQKFLTDLKMMKKDDFLILVGHNILRFDLPVIIRRMVANGIDGHGNLEDFFSNIATLDTMQCMLPFNDMRFKGLSSEGIAQMLGITPPHHKNTEIESFYKNREFQKIEQHAIADLKFVEDLYWKLKYNNVPKLNNGTSSSQPHRQNGFSRASRGKI
jgi:DNA polymerase elongation subunit (family B)